MSTIFVKMKEKPEFISIGIITKPHGIKGDVVVSLLTDDIDLFKKDESIFIIQEEGRRLALTIQQLRQKDNRLIIKFKGVENRNHAEELKSCVIAKRLDDLDGLTADEFYVFDLIDLKVFTTTNEFLGTINEVLTLSANDVYVVRSQKKEYLIPAIKSVVKKIDLEKEIMLIDPIDGLLDL